MGKNHKRAAENRRGSGTLKKSLVFLCAGALLLSGCGAAREFGAVSDEIAVAETAAAAVAEAAAESFDGGAGSALLSEGAGVNYSVSSETQPNGARSEQEASSGAGTGGTASLGEVQDAVQSADTAVPADAEALSRKLIKTIDLDAETKEYDAFMAEIEAQVKALSGYIERSETYSPSGNNAGEARRAYITARIPSDKIDVFMNSAFSLAHITRKNENVTDVTLEYTDISARQKSLRIEQERLMELLTEADSADTLILLEQRLSEIRYEIESLESQLRVYDNQVTYSTVYMNIYEVKTLTAGTEDGFLSQLQAGFSKNLHAVGTFLRDALLMLLAGIPILLPVAGIVLFVYSICRRRLCGGRKGEKKASAGGSAPTTVKDTAEKRADDEAGKTEFHRS